VIERLAADKETEETNDGKTQGLWREGERKRERERERERENFMGFRDERD